MVVVKDCVEDRTYRNIAVSSVAPPALCQQPGGRECRSCQSCGAPEAEQLVLDLGLLAVDCGNMMQYVGACLRWYPSLAMFL